MFPAQQTGDGLWIGKIVELLDEGNWPAALLCGVIVPLISPDSDAVVTCKPFFKTGGQEPLALPEQELFQIDFTGPALLIVCKVNVWDMSPPFLDFPACVCYTDSPEGITMQVVVLHGTLTDAEQDSYIRQATALYPVNIIEKLFLDVQDDHVAVSYDLHRFRNMRKMGGYCIGEPSDWNAAKQAELRDTVPNPIDGLV